MKENRLLALKLRSRPFLLIESNKGLVLKRGTIKLEITGEMALETILVILSCTSVKSSTGAEISEHFPEDQKAFLMELLEMLVEERFLFVEEIASSQIPENREDVFYWEYKKHRPDVLTNLSELNIALVGVNELSKEIAVLLQRTGVENLQIVDDPNLRSSRYYDDKERLNPKALGLEGIPILDADKFTETWENHNCKLIIASSDFGGQFLLLNWNELCVKRNVAFLPVVLQETVGFVGPLLIPGETACLKCLRLREDSQMMDPGPLRELEIHATRGQSVAVIPPAMLPMLASTVNFEILHFFGDFPNPRPGRLIRIDPMSGFSDSRQILKYPRCPVCSALEKLSSISIFRMKPMED